MKLYLGGFNGPGALAFLGGHVASPIRRMFGISWQVGRGPAHHFIGLLSFADKHDGPDATAFALAEDAEQVEAHD